MAAEVKQWSTAELQNLRRLAGSWYTKNGRSLPWRQTSDPYRIWVSEIMLQQTQVATVIPYYHRFLESFPEVAKLAAASVDEVYRHWAGLGYYRRARQMHLAAQKVVSDHSGNFPTDFESILALPGIGRYTAGAIASFALDHRTPIVEANTQRLFARLLQWSADLSSTESQAALWGFAECILPKRSGSGQINQAAMEIGSQVCLPKNPLCLLCPLCELCPTFASGLQQKIPSPKRPKEYTDLTEGAIVVRDSKGRFLMRRCMPEERWAGLWDFPRFDITQCRSKATAREQLALKFRERFGIAIHIGEVIHQLKHAVTRYRITLQCFEAEMESTRLAKKKLPAETRWTTLEQMDELALSSSGKRLWSWLMKSQ